MCETSSKHFEPISYGCGNISIIIVRPLLMWKTGMLLNMKVALKVCFIDEKCMAIGCQYVQNEELVD